jgi:hypothetical protein
MLVKGSFVGLVILVLGAGVAFAATRSTSSAGLSVCVNQTNGLMRAASECREGENSLTIGGGGGNATATQNGVFSVPLNTTAGGKTLPLTGLTLSGRCESIPPEAGGGSSGRLLLESASGTTMDAFSSSGVRTIGGTTLLLPPAGFLTPNFGGSSVLDAIAISSGATATITVSGYIDQASGSCRFLWQAVEVANS